MKILQRKEKGFTTLEMGIVAVIFSLFLMAIYTILDSGLKAWNMGQVKSDLQNSGEIILRRMVREITSCSNKSVVWDEGGFTRKPGDTVHEYVAFETPIKDGQFQYQQSKFGTPLWNGNIIYYVYPQDKPADANGINPPKNLCRKFISYGATPRTVPVPMSNIASHLTDIPEPTAEEKIIATNVDTFDVVKEGFVVKIRLVYRKTVGNENTKEGERVNNFSIAGTTNQAFELFELQSSAEPKN